MTFELVDCEPYHARLTRRACAERHEKANGALDAPRPPGNEAVARKTRLRVLRLCIACETGARRRRELDAGD